MLFSYLNNSQIFTNCRIPPLLFLLKQVNKIRNTHTHAHIHPKQVKIRQKVFNTFEQISESGLKGFGEDIPFKTKCSKVSHSLHTANL